MIYGSVKSGCGDPLTKGGLAAKEGAGEEERRRDEGAGDGAKEVARTAGGKAAGALVMGG
jgi:hypothetical protein